MPIPTPFHTRTSRLSESQDWRDWAGYLAASTYEYSHEREYYAIRNAAGLIDVSPLFKYEISGPQSEALLNRILPRNARKCAVGQVMYSPWCDDEGKVIDDGTVARLAPDRFRVTAAEPNLVWFQDCGFGLDVEVQDVSSDLAALAVQGPSSRMILKEVLEAIDLDGLKYYRLAPAVADGVPLTVSRTGYTGDLGYELWIPADRAEAIWDLIMDRGAGYGAMPAGMVALDIARIEAGLLLIQVDYVSSRKALIESQKSSPFEIGLDWTVDFQKGDFIGRSALLEEQAKGSRWGLAGLEIDWESLESLYRKYDLVPQLAGRASRAAVPVYFNGRQIGQATSQTFSPILKKYIAICTLEREFTTPGTEVEMEITVEYKRHRANGIVKKLPHYNPPWKKA